MKWAVLFLMGMAVAPLFAQQSLKGLVLEETRKGQYQALMGASVFWLGTNVGTQTDSSGFFVLPYPPSADSGLAPELVVRYLGYQPDTLRGFSTRDRLRIVLATEGGKSLKEVSVEGRIPPSFQLLDPIGTQVMTNRELVKAACCNLSESFETNPAVEVTFSDAVTGAKQIQMLGLAGMYTQMTQENLPGMRGLMAGYGLGFTPGPWIHSIQVTKGVGSVANGYESMSGQINVEIKKPDWLPKNRERFFGNVFANSMGRLEANANSTQRLNGVLATQTLVHANAQTHGPDRNRDGFMDIPTGQQTNLLHRWAWTPKNGWSAQWGIQVLEDKREGGQHHASHNYTTHRDEQYRIGLRHELLQAFGKIGYVFPAKKYKSIGWMNSWTSYQTDQQFGELHGYQGRQMTGYSQFIYQSIIGTTDLRFRVGAGYRQERFRETIRLSVPGGPDTLRLDRVEQVPGAFGELTWEPAPKWTAVAGLRADYHNRFGLWFTPRLHVKLAVREDRMLRFTLGRGWRLANPFAENTALLVSSRRWTMEASDYRRNGPHLRPEDAWNTGVSWNQGFRVFGKKGTLSADVFHTRFSEQVVLDLDRDPRAVYLENLRGPSHSTAAQVQLELEPMRRFDIRLAYKWLDVQQTYGERLLPRPLVARNRFFINLAYATRSHWSFDLTWNYLGPKRLPSTRSHPELYQFPDGSPAFGQVHAQVSKSWNKKWDVYVGVENAFDVRQVRLINQADDPTGPYFDASLVWGPVLGRMVYGGVRFLWR